MANNNVRGVEASNKEVMMNDLRSLEKLLGTSRALRKLEEILDDEYRFNSHNLKARGEYDAYAFCQKIAYGNPANCGEDYRYHLLGKEMISHGIGYVISDMLRSYTQTQEYDTCGHYSMGVAFHNNGTIAGVRIA